MSYAKDYIIPYQSVLPEADQLLTKVLEEPDYPVNGNAILILDKLVNKAKSGQVLRSRVINQREE
jgi:hypothetical protein